MKKIFTLFLIVLFASVLLGAFVLIAGMFSEKYPFAVILVVLVILYYVSYTLSKKGKLSVYNHRKIWNLILTITFFVSCGIGILLILRINYGFVLPLYLNMLYMHVEYGIVMTIVAVFHILWHLTYYKNLIRFSKKEEPCTT